jgi:hypothetical protein
VGTERVARPTQGLVSPSPAFRPVLARAVVTMVVEKAAVNVLWG